MRKKMITIPLKIVFFCLTLFADCGESAPTHRLFMSEKINDGGPAFPQHGWSNNPETVAKMAGKQGLTKREWFAGLALQGMASISLPDGDMIMGWQDMSKAAFKAADCMIAELEAEQ